MLTNFFFIQRAGASRSWKKRSIADHTFNNYYVFYPQLLGHPQGRRLNEVDPKLDRVGPVENRPSTDKLHHFVRKKKKHKNM